MSSYIVDASVVIQRLIYDNETEYAKALFRQLTRGDTLYIPEFCVLECTNVIWKQVRFRGMSPTQAEILVHDLVGLPLMLVPITGMLPRGLQIGLKHQLAVYDAVYIALAEQLNHPLITVDGRQEDAAKAEGIQTKPLSDFKP